MNIGEDQQQRVLNGSDDDGDYYDVIGSKSPIDRQYQEEDGSLVASTAIMMADANNDGAIPPFESVVKVRGIETEDRWLLVQLEEEHLKVQKMVDYVRGQMKLGEEEQEMIVKMKYNVDEIGVWVEIGMGVKLVKEGQYEIIVTAKQAGMAGNELEGKFGEDNIGDETDQLMKRAIDQMGNQLEQKEAIISELKGHLEETKRERSGMEQKLTMECRSLIADCQKQYEEKQKEDDRAAAQQREKMESQLAEMRKEMEETRKSLDEKRTWRMEVERKLENKNKGMETKMNQLRDTLENKLAEQKKQMEEKWTEDKEFAKTLAQQNGKMESQLANIREELDETRKSLEEQKTREMEQNIENVNNGIETILSFLKDILENKLAEQEKQMEEQSKEKFDANEKKMKANFRLLITGMELMPKLNTLLHTAVNGGNCEKVGQLLSLGIDPNSVDSQGRKMLHLAVKNGNAKIVDLLVQNGANLQIKNGEGLRPLHCAARDGKNKIVKILLRAGAISTDPVGKVIDSALLWAAARSHKDVVKTLLEHCLEKYGKELTKAYVNAAGDKGNTALHFAYLSGNMDLVKLLEENGADSNVKNNEWETPAQIKH